MAALHTSTINQSNEKVYMYIPCVHIRVNKNIPTRAQKETKQYTQANH